MITPEKKQGAILIVSRNNIHLTKSAVRTALAQDVPCDVLVWDNASTDGTQQWLKTKPCASTFVSYQHSLSQCWNAGIQILQIVGHEQVLVMNNDAEIRPDTFSLLSQVMDRAEHCGMVTCVSVDSQDRVGNVGDRDVETLSASARPHPDFSCFLINKWCTTKIGWFDESYFPAYCEDCDYHIRMYRARVMAWCVDLPFLHHGAQTIKSASAIERQVIESGSWTNRERFRQKYGCLPGTPAYEKLFKV